MMKLSIPAGVLVLILLLGIFNGSCDSLEQHEERLNYGVMFEHETDVAPSSDNWFHTLEIPLPTLYMMESQIPLKTKKCLTALSCSMDREYQKQRSALLGQVKESLRVMLGNIGSLLPKHEDLSSTPKRRRKTRSLLPFIADISKSLFGTATEADVQKLAKHIELLSSRERELSETMEQHDEQLASYMAVTDKRLRNAFQAVGINHNQITTLNSDIETMRHNVLSGVALSMHLSKLTDAANELMVSFLHITQACQNLLHGRISPTLVPIATMEQTIQHIETILRKKHPRFQLLHKNAQFYYKKLDLLYAFHDGKIYITIKFPVIFHDSSNLKLYKVSTFPVPINESSTDATHLVSMPRYVGITRDEAFYVEFKEDDLSECLQRGFSQCAKNTPLIPISYPTCSISILLNEKMNVKKLCDFRYSQNIITPKIQHLNGNRFLLTNVSNIKRRCPHESLSRNLPGCQYCVITLKCKCSLSSPFFSIKPKSGLCHTENIGKSEIMYPVNLALIQHFFEPERYEKIESNTLFLKKQSIKVPGFKIYSHNVENIIAGDKKDHLNLEKMVQRTKDEKKVFHSLAGPILDGYLADAEDSFWSMKQNLNSILLWGVILVLVVAIVYLVKTKASK